MSTSNTTKQSQLALLQHLIEGIKKHFAGVTQVTIASVSYTPDAIVQFLQALVDAHEAVLVAKTQAHSALEALRALGKASSARLRALKGFLLGAFADPTDLADFGLVPRKTRAAPTVDAKAAALVKRLATRAARHVMGKRQRLRIRVGDPAPNPPAAPTVPSTPAKP
jgi:hypothetical protein